MKILVTAHALVLGAAALSACGQKGPLYLPTTPDSLGRATLPESLTPRPLPPKAPAAPGAANGAWSPSGATASPGAASLQETSQPSTRAP